MKYLPLIFAGMICLSAASLVLASYFQARLIELLKERIKELEKPPAGVTTIQDWLNNGFTIRATKPGSAVLTDELIRGITIEGNSGISPQNAEGAAQ